LKYLQPLSVFGYILYKRRAL